MRIIKGCRTLALAAFVLVSGPALAQSCAGFTDVSAGDTFCPNVEWLKNRQITLGCTSATLFCPGGSVTRLAMAAFLNRLGNALTPTDLAPVAFTSAGREDLTTPPIRCQTGDYPITGFPRRAYFNSKVNVWDPSANVELVVDVMYSTNAGANWISVQDSQVFQTLRSGQTPPDDVSMYPIGFLNLDVTVPTTSIRFGIRTARQSGTGNPNVYCVNRVQIWNRTSLTSPFDEAYVAPPVERTGRAADRPPQ